MGEYSLQILERYVVVLTLMLLPMLCRVTLTGAGNSSGTLNWNLIIQMSSKVLGCLAPRVQKMSSVQLMDPGDKPCHSFQHCPALSKEVKRQARTAGRLLTSGRDPLWTKGSGGAWRRPPPLPHFPALSSLSASASDTRKRCWLQVLEIPVFYGTQFCKIFLSSLAITYACDGP